MSVDVLHHTERPEVLVSEAHWGTDLAIVLKDHMRVGFVAGLTPKLWFNKLGLYVAPANWLVDRSLHFTARLETI